MFRNYSIVSRYWRKKRMVFVTSLKNPKKIIQALAIFGPMNKWRLKEKTGLKYPRVHEVVNRLKKEGFVQGLRKRKSKKGLTVTEYSLTFKGVLAYGTLVSLQPPSIVGNPNENTEDFRKRYAKLRERYNDETEKFVEFLESYGKWLNYELFKEIYWFTKHYDKGQLIRLILRLIKRIQRQFQKGRSQLIESIKRQLKTLQKEKRTIEGNPFLQEIHVYTTVHNGKRTKLKVNHLKEVKVRIKELKRELQIAIKLEDEWLRQHFAEQFFPEISLHPRISKGKMGNKAIKIFSEEILKRKIEREITNLRRAIAPFGESEE